MSEVATDTEAVGVHGRPEDRRAASRSDARRNRARLVGAAEQVFATAGPDASLNEIARRAGVGPGTLYRHFPTRNALLAAVLSERIERLVQRAEPLLARPDADAALADWLRAFLDHAREQQGLGSALLLAESEPDLDCHRRLRETAGELLARAQGLGTTRPDVSTEEMLRLVVGVALATTGEAAEEEPSPERLLALVLDALRRPARKGRPARRARR